MKILARHPAPDQPGWGWRLAALLAAVTLSLALGLAPAGAQTPPTLATLHISLWPEFDRPGVLVILDGSLPAGTPLPAAVSLRIPAAAGQPNATAYRTADGSLLAASYTTASAGSDIIVTFSIQALDFRLEYYDPALAVTGTQRTYTFNWISDYAVTAAAVRLQQPAGATALTTLPALTSVGAGEYGLEYYEGSLGALTAGQAVQVTASYTKPDAVLSSATVVAAAPVATIAPAATSASPGLSPTTLILVVVGIMLVVAGVAAFLIMRGRPATRRSQTRRAPRRHTGSPPARSPAARRATAAPVQPQLAPRADRPPAVRPAEAAFCTQCGHRRQPGDQFCRQCGAPV